MKKSIALLFVFACVLVFVGCKSHDKQQDVESSNTQHNYILPASQLTCYTAEQPYYLNPDLEISQEQAEFILMVWNDSSWDNGIKEASCNYVFRGDNIEIQYCYDDGIFIDTINGCHVVLSSKLKKQVNQTIDKFIVLPYVD